MVRIFVFLAAIAVILVVLALISCLSAERSGIRTLPRFVWVVLILLVPLLGPIAWFLAGRPVGARTGTGPAQSGPTGRPRPRPAAPDDDPEFLKSIDAEQSRRDHELFQQWEKDLKRREDELRERGNPETPPADA